MSQTQAIKLDTFQKSRAQMLVKYPFFAAIVLSTEWVPRIEGNPTMCTDMCKVYYNPEFVESLTVDQCIFIMCHEIMHMILMHGLRRRSRSRRPRRWNHAGDYAINQELVDSGMAMPAWTQALIDGQKDPKKFQDKLGQTFGLLDKAKYNGLTAEQIYDLLEQDAQKDKGKGKGSGKGQGSGQPDDDDEDMGMDDLLDVLENMTQAEANQLKDDIKQKIAQAATMARAAGKMPNNLQILVDGVINPPQPWEVILREFMTRMVNSSETWSRRNRRFSDILPSRYDVGMGELGIVGDTSASMLANKVWAQLATEINHCNEFVKPERTRVVWADHQAAAHEQVFEPTDEVVLEPKGGGGTDMRLPLKHMEQFEPCVVILVTDCYTPWPDQPTPYPLIVAATTQAASPDWAMRLQLRDGSGD